MRQLAHNAEALVVALLMKVGAVFSKRAPLKKPHNPSRVAGTEAWRGAAGADLPRCSSLRYMTAAPRERQCCRAYLAETVDVLAETLDVIDAMTPEAFSKAAASMPLISCRRAM